MYHIREVVLNNKNQMKKRLVIEFDNPAMAIVGEFLMVDAPIAGWRILDGLAEVLQGNTSEMCTSGNRIGMDITKETTYLYDLFSPKEAIPTYRSYTIDTMTLQELVCMWRVRMNALQREGK